MSTFEETHILNILSKHRIIRRSDGRYLGSIPVNTNVLEQMIAAGRLKVEIINGREFVTGALQPQKPVAP